MMQKENIPITDDNREAAIAKKLGAVFGVNCYVNNSLTGWTYLSTSYYDSKEPDENGFY